MAPSRVVASDGAKRTCAHRSCGFSRGVRRSCQQSAQVQNKNVSHGTNEKCTKACSSDCARGILKKASNAENADLTLPLSDLNSQTMILPIIDSRSVSTPPRWKSPYVDDEILDVPCRFTALARESTFCGSPAKTPGRVAKVFDALLPITPRKASVKITKTVKHQGSQIVTRSLRAVCRLGTVLGMTAPKHQFKSLAELRRHLLQRYRSLHKAFREMENHLKECKHKDGTAWKKNNIANGLHSSMDLQDFTKAIAYLGCDSQSAQNIFELMDTNGDGIITLEEFKSSLVRMPREILLQDFRRKLLTKYSSSHQAFRELSIPPGKHDKYAEGDQSKPLNRQAFAFHLSRLGIEEQESSLLFDIIDDDSSGIITIQELRETLREVAPSVSLEEFWHRFNESWPNIRAAASSGPEGRRRATELLFKILPAKFHSQSLDLPLGLSADAWDVLCAELDVPRTNALELFRQCVTAKIWQGHRESLPGYLQFQEKNSRAPGSAYLQVECDFDDFFDELEFWSETPLARQGPGGRQSYGRDIARRLRSTKDS